jgi:hypothetical protein
VTLERATTAGCPYVVVAGLVHLFKAVTPARLRRNRKENGNITTKAPKSTKFVKKLSETFAYFVRFVVRNYLFEGSACKRQP